jgi:hypothetical protein
MLILSQFTKLLLCCSRLHAERVFSHQHHMFGSKNGMQFSTLLMLLPHLSLLPFLRLLLLLLLLLLYSPRSPTMVFLGTG